MRQAKGAEQYPGFYAPGLYAAQVRAGWDPTPDDSMDYALAMIVDHIAALEKDRA